MKLDDLQKYIKISTMYNGWNLKWYLNYDVLYPKIWIQKSHKKWEIIDINDIWWIMEYYKKINKGLYDKLDFTITYIWKPFNTIK